MADLAVRRLMLADFRSYPSLRLEVGASPVVLTGLNGAGKTNILEALSFLSPGRGLRRSKISDITRHDAGSSAPWSVFASIEKKGETIDIGTGRDAGSERRIVRVDGRKAKSQTLLADYVSAVWLTPAMDRLFTEGASGRRRFLDRLVLGFHPDHGAASLAYDHAMRERTRLLKSGKAEASWLSLLEKTMAEKAVHMAKARRDTIERLDRACREADGPFPVASLALEGMVEDSLAELDDEAAQESFSRLLRANRERDQMAGLALLGPHRSDFKLFHLAKSMPAGLCSTGEQKALLLSVILAQARIRQNQDRTPPLLLLDEVAAHLDEVRRAALFEALSGFAAQSWLTGTDASLFAAFRDRAQFFEVKDGSVLPC